MLGRTKGVPLFQEQAMKLAMVAAEFTAGELNELRKAMATFSRRGTIGRLEQKMVSRMVERGYDAAFAARCFNQIKGFGEYGFPESHAASFAHLVYVSSWLKFHHPEVFAAALLNSQPMGFYAPAQIVRDAREHGVEVRAVDVSHSRWDSTLETPSRGERAAMRLGLREVDGLKAEDAALLLQYRAQKKPISIANLHAFGVPVCRPRETRRRRLLPLAGPRPPRGTVGGEGAGEVQGPAALRLRRHARAGGGGACGAARNGALRACGE